MRLVICLSFLLLLVPASPAAQAPPAIVAGRVLLLDSAQGAAGVLVRIESLNVGVSTDSTGRYRLVVPASRIVPGDSAHIFFARRGGFPPQVRRVVLAPGAEVRVDLAVKTRNVEDTWRCRELIYPAGLTWREGVKLCSIRNIAGRKSRAWRGPP